MAINKVVYGADTLLDLTEDTVTTEDVLNSKSFHTSDGVKRTGTASYPVTDVQVNGTSVMDGTVAKVVQPTADEQTATDTFTTINGGILDSLKVSLSPNQDLHGYDSPWVAGAGKNKINCNTPTVTNNGVTVTNNGDGTFTATGTSTAQTDFYLTNSGSSDLIPLGDITDGYLVSGCPSGGGISSYQLVIGSLNSRYATDSGNGDTLTNVLQSGIRVILRVYSNYSFPTGGLTFKPMIRASGTSADFEPYSNICPISGHTEVKVGDDGKNKADPNTLEVGYYSTTGYNSSANFKTTAPISVEVGKTYFGKVFNTNDLTEKYDVVYTTFSSGDTTNAIRQVVGGSITIQSGEKYLRVRNNSDHTPLIQSGNFAYQLELGSTATAYVPYNGYQITVNLGGTYYSGTLDVVTGVFVPDKKGINLSDIGWSGSNGAFYSTNPISDIKHGGGRYDYATSSGYKTANKASLSQLTDGEMSVDASGYLQIKDNQYTASASFVSDRGSIQIVYELATPTPIQLSPTMIKALVGENHLSAPLDGQEITESKYRELFTWDEVEEIAQQIADSKIDDHNTSNETAFSSFLTESRYAKKVYDVPLFTPYYQKSSGATDITFNNMHIFNDYQTSCELIQIGSGPRVGISDVSISAGSVTFTFDAPLASDTKFVCSIMNFY